MSVYSVSNRYLDKYDPYWLCRALSLKAGSTAILLCLCNAFLKSPQSPVSYMMTILIGVIASEVLPTKTKAQRVVIFISIVGLLSTICMVFGVFSYFRYGLYLAVLIASYLLLKFMVSNAKAAAIPTLMILWGFMQLEGGAPTDLNAVMNSYLYFIEYGLMGLIVVLFFPNFKTNMFMSAFLRILESDVRNVGVASYKNSNPEVLGAITVLNNTAKILPENYTELYKGIILFQNEFMKNHHLSSQEIVFCKAILSDLIYEIGNNQEVLETSKNLDFMKGLRPDLYRIFEHLIVRVVPCKV